MGTTTSRDTNGTKIKEGDLVRADRAKLTGRDLAPRYGTVLNSNHGEAYMGPSIKWDDGRIYWASSWYLEVVNPFV